MSRGKWHVSSIHIIQAQFLVLVLDHFDQVGPDSGVFFFFESWTEHGTRLLLLEARTVPQFKITGVIFLDLLGLFRRVQLFVVVWPSVFSKLPNCGLSKLSIKKSSRSSNYVIMTSKLWILWRTLFSVGVKLKAASFWPIYKKIVRNVFFWLGNVSAGMCLQ